MAKEAYDMVVVGSGPGGYVCAIRGAQLGLKVALVEKEKTLGGTCLNVGCIPSKALLHSSEQVYFLKAHGAAHGIQADVTVDLGAMMKRKAEVVKKLVGGVAQLCEGNRIAVYHGFGTLEGGGQVKVIAEDSSEEVITGKAIVLATGSRAVELAPVPFDGKRVVSSDEAIAFDEVPGKLVVVGGGAIGLELGSVWARLGSDVTVVEFLPRIAATYDEDITKLATRVFKKQGLSIHTRTKVTGLEERGGRAMVLAENEKEKLELEADKVLVAVGRAPFTGNLGLDRVGVEKDDRGRVKVNARFETNVAGVYAIGDVIAGPMLAHKAEEDGVAAAEILAGGHGHVDYDLVPAVIYTDPEVASAGLTEALAKERGYAVRVGKFSLAANGRALASDATDGMIKIVADARTDRLLGVQVLARSGSELMAAAVAHMSYGGSAEDLGRTVHAHPTLSEAMKEAALAVSKNAIHSL